MTKAIQSVLGKGKWRKDWDIDRTHIIRDKIGGWHLKVTAQENHEWTIKKLKDIAPVKLRIPCSISGLKFLEQDSIN